MSNKVNVRSQELWFPDESRYITSSGGDNITAELISVTIFTTQEVCKLCTRRHLFLLSGNEKHLFIHLIFFESDVLSMKMLTQENRFPTIAFTTLWFLA